MKNYVLGFVFNSGDNHVPRGAYVALIKKQRPAWQQGKWNGVGGKIEPNESPLEAMSREFCEETGLDIPLAAWEHRLTMSGSGGTAGDGEAWTCLVFRAFDDAVWQVKQTTDERPLVWSVGHKMLNASTRGEVEPQALDNLPWIIPLILDNKVMPASVYYPG